MPQPSGGWESDRTPLPLVRGQTPKAALLTRLGFQTGPHPSARAALPAARLHEVPWWTQVERSECPGRRLPSRGTSTNLIQTEATSDACHGDLSAG